MTDGYYDEVYRESLHDWLDERELERDPPTPNEYKEEEDEPHHSE